MISRLLGCGYDQYLFSLSLNEFSVFKLLSQAVSCGFWKVERWGPPHICAGLCSLLSSPCRSFTTYILMWFHYLGSGRKQLDSTFCEVLFSPHGIGSFFFICNPQLGCGSLSRHRLWSFLLYWSLNVSWSYMHTDLLLLLICHWEPLSQCWWPLAE